MSKCPWVHWRRSVSSEHCPRWCKIGGKEVVLVAYETNKSVCSGQGKKVCGTIQPRINNTNSRTEGCWSVWLGLVSLGMLDHFMCKVKQRNNSFLVQMLGLVGTHPDQRGKVIPAPMIWWLSTSITAAVVRLLNVKHHPEDASSSSLSLPDPHIYLFSLCFQRL